MGDGPDGVKVEMWEQAKEWGLNIDELNPRMFGQVGEFSLKTRFELMMRRYRITVEDLKQVERGEFDYGVYKDEYIEVDEVKRMKEELDAAAAAKFAADNIWDDDDDDDDEIQKDEVEVVSRGAKRTNDGEIKKDCHVPTTVAVAG